MFFEPGTVYRDHWIESVLHTPFGEWALAYDSSKKRVYLQHVPLRKSVPQSLVDQYLSLDHPLLIPHRQVFQESKALVFVRPYLPLDGLVYRCPADEGTAMAWCDQLAKLEAYLKNQPHPMQIVYVPENIGLTDQGELRVFLCGDASYMRWDFSDRETFRRILIGEKGTGKASPELEEARKGRSRKWVWGMGVALLLCMVAGFGLLKFLQKPGEKPVQAEPEPPRQVEADPESEPASEPGPETSTEAAPPTQEDMDRSQAAAEEFIFSLDQDKYQRILKKKNRSMTVLPEMQAERINSRPGKITWDIEAEVFHSDGNMEGETYRTTFRVITAKENGVWQVKDAEVTEEEKL